MGEKEIFSNGAEDKLKLIGSKVIGIAKSELDGRKVVVLKKTNGEICHLESQKGTKITVSSDFKYLNEKTFAESGSSEGDKNE